MNVDALLARDDPVCAEELPKPNDPWAEALKRSILRAEVVQHRARRRLALLVAAGIAASAAAVTVPRIFADANVGASPAAAAVLQRAAVAASRTAPVRPGRYAYSEARTIFGATDTDDPPFTALIPGRRETWVAADGSGRVRYVPGKPYFPSPRDRKRWLGHGSPRLAAGGATDEPLRPHRADAAALAARDPETLDARELDELMNSPAVLPVDPDRLERAIRAYAKTKDPPLESAMFNQIEDLLANPWGSGELRAAVYRVLARMDGVELDGPIRDPAGRPGIAVVWPVGYDYTHFGRHRLVFDPKTGDVLAEQTLLLHPNDEVAGKPGTVLEQVVYLTSGWVDRIGARPEH